MTNEHNLPTKPAGKLLPTREDAVRAHEILDEVTCDGCCSESEHHAQNMSLDVLKAYARGELVERPAALPRDVDAHAALLELAAFERGKRRGVQGQSNPPTPPTDPSDAERAIRDKDGCTKRADALWRAGWTVDVMKLRDEFIRERAAAVEAYKRSVAVEGDERVQMLTALSNIVSIVGDEFEHLTDFVMGVCAAADRAGYERGIHDNDAFSTPIFQQGVADRDRRIAELTEQRNTALDGERSYHERLILLQSKHTALVAAAREIDALIASADIGSPEWRNTLGIFRLVLAKDEPARPAQDEGDGK